MIKIGLLAIRFIGKYGQGDPFSETYLIPPSSKEEVIILNNLIDQYSKEIGIPMPSSEDYLKRLNTYELYKGFSDSIYNQKYKDQINEIKSKKDILEKQEEFDKQDEEIAQQQKEEEKRLQEYQQSIADKSEFSSKDAELVVNSLRQIKQRYPNAKGTIITFLPNQKVSITNNDPRISGLIRKSFGIDLELAFKQFLISNKKYIKNQVSSII